MAGVLIIRDSQKPSYHVNHDFAVTISSLKNKIYPNDSKSLAKTNSANIISV